MFTDFGFQSVKESDKNKLVKNLFSDVSTKYDIMNDLMSASLHRIWKDCFVKKLPLREHDSILDLAGGTGDITFRIIKQYKHYQPQLTVCDLTPNMMREGQKRAIDQGLLYPIDWICGQGEQLPYNNHSLNGVVCSFGFRNMANKQRTLQEIYRVLKPGGWFYCLEFSKPTSLMLKTLYKLYSFHIIPKIGKYIADDEAAYQYLVESIEKFPSQEQFKQMLITENFQNVRFENIMNGIVAIHSGYKNAS